MKDKVLHLSHTDISTDSRILKEIDSIITKERSVLAIGVDLDEGTKKTSISSSCNIVSTKLRSRSLTFLPRILRHTFTLLELSFKVLKKSISYKPNVIHCHDTLVLPIGVVVKILTGAKLIYDAHELESDKNGITPILSKLTLFCEKFLWRFVDHLIVVSPSIATWYQENIGVKPTDVIMNSPVVSAACDLPNRYDEDYLRHRFNIPSDSMVFIYIGILGKGRGIELLLDVFKRQDISSTIVFLGYGELSENIVGEANNNNNIFLHSAVPHDEVLSISRSADYGMCLVEDVSLSDYYCLPNKFFEYCLAGIPVISSKFPDLQEVIERYKLGACCSLDVDSVADTVIRVENGEVNASFKVEELYELSWDHQAEKLSRIYENILSKGK